MSKNARSMLDKSAFAAISPIAKRQRPAGVTNDDTIIGGDPDSFVSRSFFNTSSAVAGAADKDALQVSMEMKLLEAQNRIRSLSSDSRKKKELETEAARERLRVAEAERLREEERSKVAQLSSLNRSLVEDLEEERLRGTKAAVTNAEVSKMQDQAKAYERQIARLEAQLAASNAAAEQSRIALQRMTASSSQATLAKPSLGDEAHVLRIELDRKTQELNAARIKARALEDVQVSNEQLRAHVQELELALARRGVQDHTEQNMLQLREENTSLKQKLARMQPLVGKLSKCESELEAAQATLAKWKVVISDEFPSLQHVQDAMATLRGQVNTFQAENSSLLESNRAMEQRVRLHDGQVSNLAKQREQLELQLQEQRAQLARVTEENSLLKESARTNQFVLEAFNKEGASFGNYDAAKSQRIVQLEEQLANQTRFCEKLQADLASASDVLEKERERIFSLETRLTNGEFNPATVQVLHLRQNPMLAQSDETQQKLAQLAGENEYLKKRLAAAKQAGASSAEIETLKKDNVNLAKRLERLKQVAHTKISEFREVVVLLFGYRVDVEFDSHTYTLTPIPADGDKKLKFVKSAGSGIQLLETPFALELSDEITQYLSAYDSVPGFLSAITLASVNNQQ